MCDSVLYAELRGVLPGEESGSLRAGQYHHRLSDATETICSHFSNLHDSKWKETHSVNLIYAHINFMKNRKQIYKNNDTLIYIKLVMLQNSLFRFI